LSASGTLKRGLFHFFGVLVVPLAALFLPRLVLLISLGVATFIVVTFEFIRLRVPVVNRWFIFVFKPLLRKKETSRFTGTSYSLTGALIAFLAFPRDIAVLALVFLAVGDSAATIVGKKLGKTRLLGQKTLEGSLACLVSCIIVGLIGYYAGLEVALLTVLVGSLGATVAEAVPLPINDNLILPLFAGLVMAVVQYVL
jgi:dolichol kinase